MCRLWSLCWPHKDDSLLALTISKPCEGNVYTDVWLQGTSSPALAISCFYRGVAYLIPTSQPHPPLAPIAYGRAWPTCRKTCQSITERRGNTNRSGLGVTQVPSGEHRATQAGPSPADRWALSPPPSFPCSNFALLRWWLSLLNGRRILLQTWAD